MTTKFAFFLLVYYAAKYHIIMMVIILYSITHCIENVLSFAEYC